MKKFMTFSAAFMLVFGVFIFSPQSCCGDFDGTQPPPDGVDWNPDNPYLPIG